MGNPSRVSFAVTPPGPTASGRVGGASNHVYRPCHAPTPAQNRFPEYWRSTGIPGHWELRLLGSGAQAYWVPVQLISGYAGELVAALDVELGVTSIQVAFNCPDGNMEFSRDPPVTEPPHSQGHDVPFPARQQP